MPPRSILYAMARSTTPTMCCTNGYPDFTSPHQGGVWRKPPAGTSRQAHSTRETADAILIELNALRAERGQEQLELLTDKRLIEAGNEFRGKRIGHGDGALWKPENLKLVRNLWRPTWGESYRSIASRVQDFALEKVDEHPGEQIVVVSHESPIWSYRHMLETGHPEHNMLLRKTALASVTSITYDNETHEVLGITYADPVAQAEAAAHNRARQ